MVHNVAVLGGLPDASWVVDELLALGYQVAWINSEDLPEPAHSSSCRMYPQERIASFSGYVGDFHLELANKQGNLHLEAAAVIIATGNRCLPLEDMPQLPADRRVLSTQALRERLDQPKKLADRAPLQRQHILFGLDMVELSGKQASTETLELALRTRLSWHCEVSVLYRELQVDSDSLENLTRTMRAEGIVFHRWQDKLPQYDDAGIHVRHADGDLLADLFVVAPVLRPRSDNADLAGILQVNLGADGYFQQLNVRSYRPGLSNRKGIFLAGRCHLDADDALAREDAALSASNVDTLLGPGRLVPETVIARVDSMKCIRCLTCIRTCPHAAVALAEYDQVVAARINELACFGCGACAANCPAKAITLVGPDLPAWMQPTLEAVLP